MLCTSSSRPVSFSSVATLSFPRALAIGAPIISKQAELDLPSPPAKHAPHAEKARRKTVFAGFTSWQIVLGLLALAGLVWSMWVTKELVSPQQDHIVSARLSSIVGDYVQAQARSASPPTKVEVEMRAFMSSLDKELERRSSDGQVVLVGEAVLTKNVPDITDSLKKAVYASGVAQPRPASAAELQRLQPQSAPAAAPQGVGGPLEPLAAPAATSAPMGAATIPAPAAPTNPSAASSPFGPAASVATFGGSDGDSGQ